MSTNLKELFVVMLIGSLVFVAGRRQMLRFCSAGGFTRRSVAWFALTIAAFLAPNFWIFVAFATLILIWIARKELNPCAAYLMLLYTVPPTQSRVPMIGISYLVDLDFPMLLSLILLVPVALRLIRTKGHARWKKFGSTDVSLILYCALTAIFFVRPEVSPGVISAWTGTDCLRRAVEFILSLFVPYFVISRSMKSSAALVESMACLCFACVLYSAVAIFEAARHWLLYYELMYRWDDRILYLTRGGAVRAMASTGHPLTLGLLLAIGLGFWFSVGRYLNSVAVRVGVTLVLAVGLLASYSRGPWIGAVIIYLMFVLLQPRAIKRVTKALIFLLIAGLFIAVTPVGTRIAQVLPFLGGTEATGDIIYRHLLFERAWQIIMGSPWLGDPSALLKMQELRQGEGIIDLINGYIVILLNNGFIGLTVYLVFITSALWRAWRVSRGLALIDGGFSRVGASIVACLIGLLVMIEGLGSNDLLFCILCGGAVGYAAAGEAFILKLGLVGEAAKVPHGGRGGNLGALVRPITSRTSMK
jgi:hypothetical protein